MRQIPIIGITGGIGSGKSFIGRLLVGMGYQIYPSDLRAKQLMRDDPDIRRALIALLGEETYTSDGELNRKYIGTKIFNDQALLQRLNAIVHPATGADFNKWKQSLVGNYAKAFACKEAAILYESGAYKGVDAVLNVYAPLSLRIQRVIERDGHDRDAVLARIHKQWPELRKQLRADITLFNDETHEIVPQLREVIAHFTAQFSRK